MIKSITTLRNIESQILNLVFLALTVLGSWIDHWFYFVCLFAAASLISILKFFHDKAWITAADKYIRVIIQESYLRAAIIFLLIIAIFLLFHYLDEQFKWFDFTNDNTFYSFLFMMVIIYVGDYFEKFVNSIKTFDEGIQLPGRKSEIIPWDEVYSFAEIEDEDKVTISSTMGEHQFAIDPADYRYTRAIIADWKLKSGRNNSEL